MDLFTYLMAKNDHNTSVNKDLFSYLLGKNQSGTYTDYSGTSISANNTKKGKMQLSLKGNTSQTGTPTPSTPIPVNVVSGDNEVVVCGKNLLNLTQFTTRTLNGITFTKNSEGSITLNGTATAEITLDTPISINLTSGTSYIISQGTTYSGSNYAISMRNQNYSVVTDTSCDSSLASKQFTFSSTTQPYYFRIYIVNGKSFNNHTIYPMVRLATITDDTYEPYQSQTYEVDLPVENLFDKDNANILNAYINANGVISNADTRSFYIPITGGNTYTIQRNGSVRLRVGTTSSIPASGTSLIDYQANDTAGSVTITTSSTANYLICYFYGTFDTNEKTYSEVLDTIQVEKGSKANHYTPYGTTPIELCNIPNTTYKDYITKNSGKNLVDSVEYNKYVSGSGNVTSGNTDYLGINDFVSCKPNTTYTISFEHDNSSGQLYVAYRDINNSFISRENYSTNRTFTTPNNAYYLFVYIYKSSTFTTIGGYVMLNEGSTALPFEPYGTGLWCKYNAIGKKVFDGSEDEDWVSAGSYQRYTITVSDFTSPSSSSTANILCNKLIATSKNNVAFVDNAISGGDENNHKMFVRIDSTITTVALLRTFLSNNSLSVYYQLSTPYLSLIEDNNLIEQLDNLQNAMSYSGTTNINQVNDDLPFNIDAKIKVGN